MSVQKIIQDAVNRNPLSMKEALQEELKSRIAVAIAAKRKEVEHIDEINKNKVDDYMPKSHDAQK